LTLVTKAAFAPLASHFHGVDEVVTLDGRGLAPLAALAGRLRGRQWHQVVDAHHVLRSHALLVMIGRRADARLTKDTAARLRLLAGGEAGAALTRTMVARFDDILMPQSAGPGQDTPGIGDRRPPLQSLAVGVPAAAGTRVPLALAPGARWATKRWPSTNGSRWSRAWPPPARRTCASSSARTSARGTPAADSQQPPLPPAPS
jgi:heptosyltransferase-2